MPAADIVERVITLPVAHSSKQLSAQRSTLTPSLRRAPSPLIANHPEKAFFSAALLVRGIKYSCQSPSSHITTNHPWHRSLGLTNHPEQGTRGAEPKPPILPPSLIQRGGPGKTDWVQDTSGEDRSAAFPRSAACHGSLS